MANMSPYAKKLYTEFNLTIPQAKAIAKATKPSTKVSAATTQVRVGGMSITEGKRVKSPSAKAERGRTTVRTSKKK